MIRILSILTIAFLATFIAWQAMQTIREDIEFTEVLTVAGFALAIVPLVRSRKGEALRIPTPIYTGRVVHAPELPSNEIARGLNLTGALAGGFFGGGLSGFLFSILYRRLPGSHDLFAIPEITLGLGLAFTALVVVTRVSVAWLQPRHPPGGVHWLAQKEIVGSLLGCVAGGLLVGIPLGWHFAKYKETRPFTPPELLIGTLVPGCVIATMLFLFSELGTKRGNRWKILCVGVLCASLWGFIGYAISETCGLESLFRNLMYRPSDRPIWHLIGGSLYGGYVSLYLGLTMGTSSWLARLWIGPSA